MADDQVRIDVDDLRALRKALREADPELQKKLRVALKHAAEVVAENARSRVPVVKGKAKGSIRATSNASGAFVIGGKKTVKYYGWLDFGSRTPRIGLPRSVGPWTHSGQGPKSGRFIYPAFKDKFGEVLHLVDTAISDSIKEAGFIQ